MSKITVLKNYWDTKYHRRFRDRSELEAYQQRKLLPFLSFLKAHSPIYQSLLSAPTHEAWQRLPVVHKAWMMANFDALNTVGISKDEAFAIALKAEHDRDFAPMIREITVGLSSGTSGNRGMFLVSPNERFRWAGTIIAKLLPHSILRETKIAFFLRANSNLYTAVRSNRLQFAFYDLLHPLETHVSELNVQQPDLLIAPPSMLRYLAEQKQQGTLHINPLKVVSVAEVLDPLDQRFIAEAFGQIVHQVYQATEGFLGVTCHHGTLHLNEDLLLFERDYLDEARTKFSPILTDFNRRTQPIVRYRLDDILTLSDVPCPCGSVLTAISHIEGRNDDCLVLSGKSIFPDFFRRAIITASDSITAYRVVQTATDGLEVHLQVKEIPFGQAKSLVSENLEALFQQFGVSPPHVSWLPIEKELPQVVKRRRIERKIEVVRDW